MIRSANLTLSVSRNAGGLFDGVRRLVQSQTSAGMDSRVFAIKDDFTEADSAAWEPIKVQTFPPSWPRQLGYSPSFLKELAVYEPDVAHTHGIWVYPSSATNRYCRKTRTPYIISPHGMLDGWAVNNSRWKKAVAHFLYEGAHLREARCLRALCEAEARAIRELGLSNDIAIIPNGIDFPTGLPDSPAPWSGVVGPGQKVILFLARLHAKKGLVNLINAWAASRLSESSEWVLAIAGWDQGGHEQELKQLAGESGIVWTDIRPKSTPRPPSSSRPPSIVFLGPQFGGAKAACYHYSDAFILPSFSEGVPMTVLEAWTRSKPVLITPQCNLPEGFAAGAAMKVDPAVKSLTGGLIGFSQLSDEERIAMGRRGYALASQKFVWPRIADQMKEVYMWMLGGGQRPACMADF
jgi:glycosyltransferase involved in cell wall biosynthesis